MASDADTRPSRYQIQSALGAGGMGEVYLAQDTELDRKLALKILPGEATANLHIACGALFRRQRLRPRLAVVLIISFK